MMLTKLSFIFAASKTCLANYYSAPASIVVEHNTVMSMSVCPSLCQHLWCISQEPLQIFMHVMYSHGSVSCRTIAMLCMLLV